MSLPAFDTLKYAEQLEKSGLTREQAAIFARAQLESLKELMEEKLVTKELLFEVKQELLEKLATKDEMKWLFGATIAILTLVMSALKFFH